MPLASIITGDARLWAGAAFGFIFGALLHKGGVTDYNVIVNQFRLRDFTVMKVMLTAILVGGAGVLMLHAGGLAHYHIKPADLLAVTLGAALFGIGMAVYGYCPGTGVAAIATGSLHALAGFAGMLAGGALYAFSYDWVAAHILPVGAVGKLRLPDVTPIPAAVWFVALAAGATALFVWLERREKNAPPRG